MNGMELAKKIRERDRNVVIVFTTGITDYLEEGYEVEALHYLIKPLNEEKVRLCLEKAKNRRQEVNYLILHTEEESLSELEETLEDRGFVKCHRSYLCRIGNIHHIGKEEIVFDDGQCIPVSRRLYNEVNKRFIEHFRREKCEKF